MDIDIEQVLNDLQGPARAIVSYRDAVKPQSRALSVAMSALFGKRIRQSVPVLASAVEAISTKLFVKRISLDSATGSKTVAGWLAQSGWARLERRLWEAVVRDGRAYLLVTYEQGRPRLTMRPAYDGAQGAALLADGTGINVYSLGDGLRCVDLFYPNRVEKYRLDEQTRSWVPRRDAPDEQWPLDWTSLDGAPLGCALIAFGEGHSAIAEALPVAADLNEALLDLAATSRSQGWPQRYISGDDGGVMKNVHGQALRDSAGNPVRREVSLEPGAIVRLEGKDSKLDQLPAAKLDRTLLDVHLELMSLLTGVPQHRFTGQWPSGAALLHSETRLNTRVEDYQGMLTGSLEATITLMLRLSVTFGGVGVAGAGVVSVEWFPPRVDDPEVTVQMDKSTRELYEAGLLSLETAIGRLHPDWTPEQVEAEVQRIRPVSMPTE